MRYAILLTALILASCTMQSSRSGSSPYFKSSAYEDPLGHVVLSHLPSKECKISFDSPKRKTMFKTYPVFNAVMNPLIFTDHAYGHPVSGEWTEIFGVTGCSVKTIKVSVTANNGKVPVFGVQ